MVSCSWYLSCMLLTEGNGEGNAYMSSLVKASFFKKLALTLSDVKNYETVKLFLNFGFTKLWSESISFENPKVNHL